MTHLHTFPYHIMLYDYNVYSKKSQLQIFNLCDGFIVHTQTKITFNDDKIIYQSQNYKA